MERPSPEATTPGRRGHTRLAAGLVIGGLATAFALLNTGDVKVNWIFGTWQTPVIVVIVVCVLVGVVLDRVTQAVHRRRGARRR